MPAATIVTYPPSAAQARAYEGKFLHLRWRGQVYLLFAARERHRYHNQILARFAAEQGIAHRWVREDRLELDAPELAVLGGGRFRLDLEHGYLDLWDNSQVYGRFDGPAVAAALAEAGGPWSGLELRIA